MFLAKCSSQTESYGPVSICSRKLMDLPSIDHVHVSFEVLNLANCWSTKIRDFLNNFFLETRPDLGCSKFCTRGLPRISTNGNYYWWLVKNMGSLKAICPTCTIFYAAPIAWYGCAISGTLGINGLNT